ncbi:MAG: cysteine--tRNA ligase [Candidatus Dormibacteria bacterium]
MRLYDTASRSVRPVELGGRITLYVCGITPYDSAHLGHAFTYHTFDVLTRRLRAVGQEVRSVRNITDVDDDILRVSRERGVGYLELAEAEVRRFDRDLAALNISPVDVAPRATARVPAMVEWVARLVRDGVAYANQGWVYFAVRTFDAYGRLSGLDGPAMLALSRERGADPDDPRKRDPLDFVLWQPSSAGEPSWSSPWGEGRPGWHIECSVLSTEELGQPIDIHGGGEDLIYPHHESEIAQVEAGRGGRRPFVRHWAHVAMVGLDGVKMSKSLGNLVWARDLVEQEGAGPVRLLLAAHHYRAAWSYEAAELTVARQRWERMRRLSAAGARVSAPAAVELERIVLQRLGDDLDTVGALHALDSFVASLAGPDEPTAAAGPSVPVPSALDPVLALLGCPALQTSSTTAVLAGG